MVPDSDSVAPAPDPILEHVRTLLQQRHAVKDYFPKYIVDTTRGLDLQNGRQAGAT